jgi:Fe-S cluster biogenesis protein NfuA
MVPGGVVGDAVEARHPGRAPPRPPSGRPPATRASPGTSACWGNVGAWAVAAHATPRRRTAADRARHNGVVEPIDDEERARREGELRDLLDLMRPAVQADGGDLELVELDVEAGVVEVQLQGSCSSCAISATTLQGGVERILRERLPWVTEVRGGVDESIDPFESAALGQGAYVRKF